MEKITKPVRVRFAPSPTGSLHLGNIRAALLNYLFAKKYHGTFILRIEDTDEARNIDDSYLEIVKDLNWLGLTFSEGPTIGGNYGPYLQSERKNLYQENLDDLIESDRVYRCFCTQEELEERRKKQIAEKKPPHYDRTCINLSDDMMLAKITQGMPFVWRLKLNHEQTIDVKTMERGTISFELSNFSDPVLARSDGSFMFTYANFIDDWLMEITHVIRGEDHLSNTAIQGALFDAFLVPLPLFCHLSFFCDASGKKLSKRDFGFSLKDLKDAGILPQAICNYLALCGSSFKEEIQSLDELVESYSFEHMHSTGPIKYDYEKLRWINHKWINRISSTDLEKQVLPFLHAAFPQSRKLESGVLSKLISSVKETCHTLAEFASSLSFYFQAPSPQLSTLKAQYNEEEVSKTLKIISDNIELFGKGELFFDALKSKSKELGIGSKTLWGTLRYLLTGSFNGMGIHDLCALLGTHEVKMRLTKPL
jgi:nondiscriminating glutamyl-tRNA synthetase